MLDISVVLQSLSSFVLRGELRNSLAFQVLLLGSIRQDGSRAQPGASCAPPPQGAPPRAPPTALAAGLSRPGLAGASRPHARPRVCQAPSTPVVWLGPSPASGDPVSHIGLCLGVPPRSPAPSAPPSCTPMAPVSRPPGSISPTPGAGPAASLSSDGDTAGRSAGPAEGLASLASCVLIIHCPFLPKALLLPFWGAVSGVRVIQSPSPHRGRSRRTHQFRNVGMRRISSHPRARRAPTLLTCRRPR